VLNATGRRLAATGDAGVSVLLRACCVTSARHAEQRKKFSVDSGNKRQRWQLMSTRESSSSFVRGDDVIASAICAERLVMIQ
jgi:hypothetical protein